MNQVITRFLSIISDGVNNSMSELKQGDIATVVPKPEITEAVLAQWQGMIDMMAAVCKVPAALLMKLLPHELEVVVAADVEGNPYHPGERASLDTGLYCETVMSNRDLLVVPDALKDPQWENNPDVEHGLTCYVGYPLIWPDGEIFGTICALDTKEESANSLVIKYVKSFQETVQSYLESLFEIQKRRLTEEELRLREKQYRIVAETSPDWIWTMDTSGRITYSNPGVSRLLGIQASDIHSSNIFDFMVLEDRAKCEDTLRSCVDDCRGWDKLELRWLNSDGSIHMTESSGSPILDALGNVVGFSGVDRDITEKKHFQLELEKMDKLMELTLQILPAPVAVIDHQINRDIYKNPKWQDLFGYDHSRFQSFDEWSVYAYPDSDYRASVSEEWRKKVATAVATKSPQFSESFVTCADGSVKFVQWGVVSDGQFVVIFCLDITRLKETEKRLLDLNENLEKNVVDRSVELAAANQRLVREVLEHLKTASDLKESESMMNLIIDSAPMGVFVIHEDNYAFVNEPFRRILGLPDDLEVVGKPASSSFGDDWANLIQELMTECSLDQANCSLSGSREVNIDTIRAYLNVAIKMTTWRNRQATVGFVSDETKEVELRTRLNRAQKMEALGSLAGGIAHDFNNILHGILGFTEMAMNRLPEDSDVRDRLDKALAAVDRAAKLVQHILAFSRESEQERKPVLMSPILKEALEFVRASVTTGIEIRKSVRSGLHTVNADPTQLHQIIMNLCTNAAHAMRTNGGTLTVGLDEVTLPKDGLGPGTGLTPGIYQRLTVSDTGHGIDESIIGRVFDPYFTTKEHGEGTGLGLSVIDSIIRGYGGTITVRSIVGKGTTFEVYLPVIMEPEAPAEESWDAEVSGKGTILFVDDERMITQSNKQLLEALGYDVVAENNPLRALAIFESSPQAFDLVITDVSMPKMNGLELAKTISAIRKDVPIILITGYSDLVDDKKLDQYGVCDLVYKPVRSKIFSSTIALRIKSGC